MYYADDSLCDVETNTRKGYPTRDTDETGKMAPWPSPFILMVDRGHCTFVKKVRNAQRSGAAGVIIADNTCLCADTECMNQTGNPSCESQEPIMADDGSGADISIPSFLMFKHDADKVKEELKADHPVQIEMTWSLPNPDEVVEYELWTTPTDVVSREYMRTFKTIAKALMGRAYFTPHFYIYDGLKSGCNGVHGENLCHNLCTNHGRYCATDPDNDLDHGISGADVVTESLRRLCIWNHYGAKDGVGEVFWDYITEFMARCSISDYFASDDCIRDAYKHAGVDGPVVDRCMSNSGGLENDSSNSFLDVELSTKVQRGVVIVPTTYVNNAPLRGALTTSIVFKALCAGFADGTTPEICSQCSACSEPVSCILGGGSCSSHMPGSGGYSSGGSSGGGVSTHTFFTTMLFIFAGLGGVAVWHYKKTRDDMRDQVRGILAEYMPLEDNDSGAGGGVGGMTNPMGYQSPGATSLIG